MSGNKRVEIFYKWLNGLIVQEDRGVTQEEVDLALVKIVEIFFRNLFEVVNEDILVFFLWVEDGCFAAMSAVVAVVL